MLVKSKDKKGKERRTIEFVPLYLKDMIEQSEAVALEYFKNRKENPLNEPEILINKIKKDTLFKVDGFMMWISSRTGKQLVFKGAIQLLLPSQETKILKNVIKFIKRKVENRSLKLTEKDELTDDMLLELYDRFVYKIQNTIYGIHLGKQGENLQNGREKFINLTSKEKCIVLSEILRIFQCQSGEANLSLIDGGSRAGRLYLNSNITKCKQISIINQSSTGIYEQEIDLLKV